jgi:hypothetical protein
VRQANVARACGASAASRSLFTHNRGGYSPASAAAIHITGNTRLHHCTSELKESYDHILVERRFPEDTTGIVGGGVGIISLHRPNALNALCDALFEDLIHAVRAFDDDDDIGCVVITGSGKAFAAGEFDSS